MTVRQATFDDFIAIRLVASASWTLTYKHIIPIDTQAVFLQKNYSDNAMRNRLERSLLLVSETDGVLNGFANFFPSNKDVTEAELGALYVLRESQANGIGTELLKAGIGELIGIKQLFVDVEKGNLSGIGFYRSKGFIVVTEYVEQFHGHKLNLLRMVLDIKKICKLEIE